MKSIKLAALALLSVAGCATAGHEDNPPRLSDREERTLARALEGKVAGPPVACVSRVIGSDGLQPISDSILIYRINRNLTYRNNLNGACSGIARGNTLVLEPKVDQFCRGDIARSVDLTTRMQVGSCALGDFIPYRTPGTGPAGS
jgi:hypothetical protein